MIKIPYDKKLHFIAGAFAFSIISLLASPLLALLGSAVVGVLKEVYDHYFGGTVDAWDAVATGLGGLFIYVIYILSGV